MGPIIGTAGWNIPVKDAERFGSEGSALERYSTRLSGVEINSSFHRPHRAATWARWAASVPDGFRFSVKMPKAISHQAKLVDCEEATVLFLEDVAGLGAKLGILLLQLPPKREFDSSAADYLVYLRSVATTSIAIEPRHPNWFEDEPDALLASLGISRVAADPALSARAALPGGHRDVDYWRLHGSPVIYRSSYQDRIQEFAARIAASIEAGRQCWCMFDNTASSAATADALSLAEALGHAGRSAD